MGKVIGTKKFADSYVVLKDGTLIFANEKEEKIATQLSEKQFVRLTVSSLIENKTINIPVSNINYFGQT